MSDQRIESIRKMMTFIREVLQFAFVVAISVVAITAFAKPSWVRHELVQFGIEIKEFSLGGVKFAVAQSIAISSVASEAQATITDAQATLKASNGSAEAVRALDEVATRIKVVRATLDEKEGQLKRMQSDAGIQPAIPSSAWITLGVLSETSGLLPAVKIDKGRTIISGNMVKNVALKYDAIVRSEDECAPAIDISLAPAVTDAERQRLVMLLKAGEYKAEETHTCPGRSKGFSIVSARIALTESAVRLAQYQLASE